MVHDVQKPEYNYQLSSWILLQTDYTGLFGQSLLIRLKHGSSSNKGLDTINLSNILNHKNVTPKIPPYFNNQSTPLISYTYTKSIASKIFNYKETLHDLDTKDYKSTSPSCTCTSSPFNYSPLGHVISGHLNIVRNDRLRNLLSKGPKHRAAQTFAWRQNFKIIMDSFEDYATRWAKAWRGLIGNPLGMGKIH